MQKNTSTADIHSPQQQAVSNRVFSCPQQLAEKLQQLERDSEIKRRSHCCCKGNKQVGDPCLFHEQDDIDCCHSADPRLQNLRVEFQKQIDKLEREEGIDELNRNVEEIHHSKNTVLSSSYSNPSCSKGDSSTTTRSKNIKTGSKNEVGRSGAPSAVAHGDSTVIAAATVAKSDITSTSPAIDDGDDASIKPICTRSTNNNNNSVGPVRNKKSGPNLPSTHLPNPFLAKCDGEIVLNSAISSW
ncbi:hypothetical protein Ocin01_11162 [Orchesella cincta]|uniref:Uncharacterized protein n=1 Tax=Orchesella cincta TaxID=48709 RepID=A0A1D2MRJ6_ORCCI|nr:hypothetical protein Ocin01_11162 [Orchesella cincta]